MGRSASVEWHEMRLVLACVSGPVDDSHRNGRRWWALQQAISWASADSAVRELASGCRGRNWARNEGIPGPRVAEDGGDARYAETRGERRWKGGSGREEKREQAPSRMQLKKSTKNGGRDSGRAQGRVKGESRVAAFQ